MIYIATVFLIVVSYWGNAGGTVVACCLITMILEFITEILNGDLVAVTACIAASAGAFFYPPLAFAVPGTFYSLFSCERSLPKGWSYALRILSGAVGAAFIFRIEVPFSIRIAACLTGLFALYLAYKTDSSVRMEKEMTARYDAARSSAIDAGRLSKEIMKNADNEVYMARLKERNRIAREIHDNVGHMITRVIVQMQAIKIINRDDNVGKQLDSVSETLDLAMTGIRKSVHELHDDSIDLSIGINDIVKVIEDRFDVTAETSIESPADNELKSNILGIVKEAVTNIAKYSKGDKVEISLVENVTFWRLQIFDNGRNEEREIFLGGEDVSSLSGGGIGLQNIGARARAMDGRATVKSGRDGFTVLVTIPKERNRS